MGEHELVAIETLCFRLAARRSANLAELMQNLAEYCASNWPAKSGALSLGGAKTSELARARQTGPSNEPKWSPNDG